MMKKTIGRKIIFTFMIILVFSFGVLGFLFNAMVRTLLVREVQSNLQNEGKVLVNLYSKVALNNLEKGITEKRPTFRLVNRLFEGNYLIVDQDNNVLFSSRPKIIPVNSTVTDKGVSQALKGNVSKGLLPLNGRQFVEVSLPIKNQNGRVKGALVMISELKGIQQLGTSIIRMLLIGFLLVGVVTIMLVVLLARSISKPVKVLEAGARKLGARDFNARINLHSDDELEQLGNTFNHMAQELQDYDRAQRKFLQNASHELKTPLMSIQGYAEGIKDGVLEGAEKEKGLEIIIAESKRLKELVNELIYLSKLETMEEVYDFQEHDLGEIMLDSVDKMAGLARQKGIRIETEILRGFNHKKIDREKLTQVFINLISNGIRFASSEVKVILSSEPGALRLEFQDDGAGFGTVDVNRIFDRFYIGQKGNTGLGLAITKAIVEKHGGQIWACNKNPGASIFINLPE